MSRDKKCISLSVTPLSISSSSIAKVMTVLLIVPWDVGMGIEKSLSSPISDSFSSAKPRGVRRKLLSAFARLRGRNRGDCHAAFQSCIDLRSSSKPSTYTLSFSVFAPSRLLVRVCGCTLPSRFTHVKLMQCLNCSASGCAQAFTQLLESSAYATRNTTHC